MLVGRKIKRRGDMELFTTNALKNLAETTLENVKAFASDIELVNEVK